MAQILELRPPLPASGPALFRVMLVEPDPVRAQWLQQGLAAGGELEVACWAHCDQGVHALRSGYWDLVVADVDLPDLAGGSGDESFRLSGHGAPLLLLSQRPGMEVVQKALRNRAEGLLLAPIDLRELRRQALAMADDARQRLLRERNIVLAIGAHPDDVEIGCGGALARHSSKGDRVVVLTLSRGANGGDVVVRTQESERAAAVLAAELRFGELPDARIPDGIETIALIEAAVRELAPTYVYTHSLHDVHQDHRNVHLASVVGARNVPNLYCYQSPSSTTGFQPTLFIDIRDHMERKIKSVAAYESQLARSASLHPDTIIATANYWGRYAGHSQVEPMEVIRRWER